MAAKKPQDLHTRHSTKAEIEKRAAQEEALLPKQNLPKDPAALFEGHPVALATWRRLMREFEQLQAVIVTRLDMDMLVDYCILSEQATEIDFMRKVAYRSWLILGKLVDEYSMDEEKKEAAEMVAMKVVNLFDSIIKLDGRADRKRDMLMKLRQQMYLTPRARAGTDPKKKPKEEPEDPFEKMLNERLAESHAKVNGRSGDEE